MRRHEVAQKHRSVPRSPTVTRSGDRPGGVPHSVAPGKAWGWHGLTPLPGVPKPPPAPARRVVFKDEVTPPRRPPGRVPPPNERQKPGTRSAPPELAPRPHAVPDYVVKYPAIRSPRQREGYKGVFQDQLAEYTELLGEVRAAQRGLPGLEAAVDQLPRHAAGRTDSAFLAQLRRCQYLKQKLTHIKARIQEYDRDARSSTGCA